MDKKQKEKYLQELKKIERKKTDSTNEMTLISRTNDLLSLLIRVLLERS